MFRCLYNGSFIYTDSGSKYNNPMVTNHSKNLLFDYRRISIPIIINDGDYEILIHINNSSIMINLKIYIRVFGIK